MFVAWRMSLTLCALAVGLGPHPPELWLDLRASRSAPNDALLALFREVSARMPREDLPDGPAVARVVVAAAADECGVPAVMAVGDDLRSSDKIDGRIVRVGDDFAGARARALEVIRAGSYGSLLLDGANDDAARLFRFCVSTASACAHRSGASIVVALACPCERVVAKGWSAFEDSASDAPQPGRTAPSGALLLGPDAAVWCHALGLVKQGGAAYTLELYEKKYAELRTVEMSRAPRAGTGGTSTLG